MGMSLNTSKKGNRRRKPMSDINVTPFVDVMLVLLIIFMVTAPLMTVGVPVELPQSKEAPSMSEKTEPLTITVTKEGKVYLQESEVALEALVPQLQAITQAKPDTHIYVRGDKDVAYGQIMGVMGTLSAAGFQKVGLIAERPKTLQPTQKR